jgi:hypothetical protein
MSSRQAQARLRLRLVKLGLRKPRVYTLDGFFKVADPETLVPFFSKEAVFNDCKPEYYQ